MMELHIQSKSFQHSMEELERLKNEHHDLEEKLRKLEKKNLSIEGENLVRTMKKMKLQKKDEIETLIFNRIKRAYI